MFLRRSDTCTSPRIMSAQARYKLCFGSARINWWSLLNASLNIWSSLEGKGRVQQLFTGCMQRYGLKRFHVQLSNTQHQCPRSENVRAVIYLSSALNQLDIFKQHPALHSCSQINSPQSAEELHKRPLSWQLFGKRWIKWGTSCHKQKTFTYFHLMTVNERLLCGPAIPWSPQIYSYWE